MTSKLPHRVTGKDSSAYVTNSTVLSGMTQTHS